MRSRRSRDAGDAEHARARREPADCHDRDAVGRRRLSAAAQWTVGTTRVTSNGQPLVISTGSATCTPTGVPLLTVSSQVKATGT